MESLLLIIGLITCATLVVSIIELIFGFHKIKNLSDQRVPERQHLPAISIVLSALNEEKDIELALKSLIYLDYPNLEIIAINDRSTDKTRQILERLQKDHAHLRVYHIDKLPDGWFGKNHALHVGSQIATGEWLLFTDADVLMKSGVLLKAISYVLENKLDHLTIYEHHIRNQFWVKILMLAHYITYSMVMKPWRIRYSWSKRSLGHGAFNLVNKQVYQQCGGHESIAMECMDDLKLGELLKKKGFRQDTVDGRDFIEREWYKSLIEMIDGCKKNSFAYFKYRLVTTCLLILAAFVFYVWPFFGIIFTGYLRWINILNIGLTFSISLTVAKQFRLPKRYAIFYPLGICILLYSIVNSALSFYTNKGVIWRGTFYSIKKLRS